MKRASVLILLALCGFAAVADRYVSTGAVVTQDGDAEIYTWSDTNTVGTIVVPEGGALFDMLLVGGGGAGGWCRGGGGGGGGVVYQKGIFLEAGTYSVTVGAGGVPDVFTVNYNAPESTEATDGRPTTISNGNTRVYMAYGGGGGANFRSAGSGGNGRAGGSSGGASGSGKSATAALDSGAQGHAGGAVTTDGSYNFHGGGGGGGGADGGSGTSEAAGDGGAGYPCSISGTEVLYGAGGGGGTFSSTKGTSGAGGAGGGGHGGWNTNADRTAGQDGVGAGGGGGSGYSPSVIDNCGGARGGSGIAIFRTAASARPSCSDVQVAVSGTTVTFSSTLTAVGTDSTGSTLASSCTLRLAYGTDSNNLDHVRVAAGWTLSDPECSLAVTDIPAYSKFYWRAALTNNLDHGAETIQSGYDVTTGDGVALPLKYSFTDPTVRLYTTSSLGDYDLPGLVDGSTDIGCNLAGNVSPTVLFDAGEAKTVRLVRVYCSLPSPLITTTLDPFELYGSNDRAAWTKLADSTDFVLGIQTSEWMHALPRSAAAFRYFEMRGVLDARLDEIELVSEELMLELDKPEYYLSTALGSECDSDGVTISGKLVNSPSTATEVYGYYAKSDYDDDESAWIANGTKFAFDGTYATGGEFSRKVAISGRGTRYVRLFAKAGDVVTSSQRSWEIALKTAAKVVPAYVCTTGLAAAYDGNVATTHDTTTRDYVILDLRGLSRVDSVNQLRVWPRNQGHAPFVWSRTRCANVYVSYDDAEITPSGATLVEGREVYPIAAEPSVDWVCVKPYLDDMVNLYSTAESVYFDLPQNARPTFLKIGNFYNGNCCEVELRTVQRDPGLVIICR